MAGRGQTPPTLDPPGRPFLCGEATHTSVIAVRSESLVAKCVARVSSEDRPAGRPVIGVDVSAPANSFLAIGV